MLAELEEAEQHLQSVTGQLVGVTPEEDSVRRSLHALVEGTVAARRMLASTAITARPASWARSGAATAARAEAPERWS
jgi:hypothetical protein